MFELFASSLAEAGITAELNYQPLTAYRQSTFAMKFTDGAAVGPLAGSPRDPDSIFTSIFSSTSALKKWAGTPPPEMAELDTRIAKQRTLTDTQERIDYITEMQRWMATWMPTVPYHANSSYGWAQPYIQDFQFKAGYAFISDVVSRWSFTEDRLKKG
jgi:ABC-type transport system substrate-binding protein